MTARGNVSTSAEVDRTGFRRSSRQVRAVTAAVAPSAERSRTRAHGRTAGLHTTPPQRSLDSEKPHCTRCRHRNLKQRSPKHCVESLVDLVAAVLLQDGGHRRLTVERTRRMVCVSSGRASRHTLESRRPRTLTERAFALPQGRPGRGPVLRMLHEVPPCP